MLLSDLQGLLSATLVIPWPAEAYLEGAQSHLT
jgi:hypothetical protein